MDRWFGGGRPVAPDAVVEFQLRDGTRGQSPASLLRWDHSDPPRQSDVVAYRELVPVDVWGAAPTGILADDLTPAVEAFAAACGVRLTTVQARLFLEIREAVRQYEGAQC